MAQRALAAFEHVVQATPGFRLREGQHAMAACVADALSKGDLGEHADPQRSIAVVQAGTGVGKSAAYASVAIALALERKTRVLISTATVALQEQLMSKDLPALANTLPQPFEFALAKGRGRYVCKLKLEQNAHGSNADDDLFELDYPAQALSTASRQAQIERREALYRHMVQWLDSGAWDGDRDSLADAPDGADWSAVAADRHSCTVRQCPAFRDCCYYTARSRLVQAQVIVANHDLVLASLGTKNLPELDNCLVVFDEGHHLGAVALDQFSSAMDISHLRWLDRLPRTLGDVALMLNLPVSEDVATVATDLRQALTQLGRMVLDTVQAAQPLPTERMQSGATDQRSSEATVRFPHGQLPPELTEPVGQVLTLATTLSRTLDTLASDIKTLARDDPSRAAQCAEQFARLGPLAPRLQSVCSTASLLLEHGEQPLAKWLKVASEGTFLTLSAHACPIVPGDLLRQFLWSRVRAALVTSASLTSCGRFDYFLHETGLSGNPNVTTLQVQSPFDYAAQGSLQVRITRADPKNASAYTAEMVQALVRDLRQVERGALVLFTSRAQMRAAVDALPAPLLEKVLVQGTQSRARLLASHAARVESGQASVLFGLQSFGEGLDLPGALCEWLFITKLPFAPPTEPVDEARAEWLRRLGRDPFSELVIPATGMRLLQWTGRAIRTEDDRAHIVCYDKRLVQQTFGRLMLAGLPPYPVQQTAVDADRDT